jgi:hypothetical protein
LVVCSDAAMSQPFANLAAESIIVAFCKKYDGQVCPTHLRL